MKNPFDTVAEKLHNIDGEKKRHYVRRLGQVISWSVIGVVGYVSIYYALSSVYKLGGVDEVNRLLKKGALLWADGMPVVVNGEKVVPLGVEAMSRFSRT